MKRLAPFFLALSIFCLAGCGYRFGNNTAFSQQPFRTLAIPYVTGDLDGSFTSQLTYVVASLGKWRVQQSEADLILKVSLIGTKSEEVGYNRAIQNGQVMKWLTPNENRLSRLASVELIDAQTQKVLYGPEYVSSSIVYDYDPNFNVDNLVRFSLAQYNFQEISSRIATDSLDKRLAKSIAEYLNFAL